MQKDANNRLANLFADQLISGTLRSTHLLPTEHKAICGKEAAAPFNHCYVPNSRMRLGRALDTSILHGTKYRSFYMHLCRNARGIPAVLNILLAAESHSHH